MVAIGLSSKIQRPDHRPGLAFYGVQGIEKADNWFNIISYKMITVKYIPKKVPFTNNYCLIHSAQDILYNKKRKGEKSVPQSQLQNYCCPSFPRKRESRNYCF
jgi:hypothetical protein